MKIAFLAPHSSIHAVRWVNEMVYRGHEAHLITMHPGTELLREKVKIYILPHKAPLGYYLNAKIFKRLLHNIKPDLLNTHYASGYGTLARLSQFHPNLLSVWGSDVFDFPYQSWWKRIILKKNLLAADYIASTSSIMTRQVESIVKLRKEITITPFGIDCEKFMPNCKERDNKKIRIGTVKRMAPKYGISTLIKAYAIARRKGLQNSELILVGGGPQENELRIVVSKLGLTQEVKFIGSVSHADVPNWLNTFDIYCALSESESFGVAVIEASACEVPVIVSDVGGLPEVVEDGKTGFIIPLGQVEVVADKIIELAKNQELRHIMGKTGREVVLKQYEWQENADRMERLYSKIISEYR
jgi:glycosyltransferase involved in cell wall biosynthesis